MLQAVQEECHGVASHPTARLPEGPYVAPVHPERHRLVCPARQVPQGVGGTEQGVVQVGKRGKDFTNPIPSIPTCRYVFYYGTLPRNIRNFPPPLLRPVPVTEQLITISEAAVFLGTSASGINNLLGQGRFTTVYDTSDRSAFMRPRRLVLRDEVEKR